MNDVEQLVRPAVATMTISLYGATDYGMGHILDGRSANPDYMSGYYRVSVAESLGLFEELLTAFAKANDIKTGSHIKVTIEAD